MKISSKCCQLASEIARPSPAEAILRMKKERGVAWSPTSVEVGRFRVDKSLKQRGRLD